MVIIYRCCERDTNRNFRPAGTIPDWMDKRKCFKSLMNSLQGSGGHKIIVVHDGPNGPLDEYIKQFKVDEYTNINLCSNEGSLRYCYSMGKSLNQDVYFLEDDYLHTENAIKILEEGLPKFQLISGYDHPDRYTRTDDIPYKQEEISVTSSTHWRTAEATTCTWMATKDILGKIVDLAIKFGLEDRNFFRYIYKTMNIRLWQSLPGVSTHVTTLYQSPLIDWKKINDNIVL